MINKNQILEIAKILILAALIFIPLRLFVFQPFFVRGESMEPNFYSGDYLIIDEISLFFKEPQRGEVVVFRPPFNPRVYYIKRIIGLPNETVIIKDGKIIIKNQKHPEGFVLKEDYLPPGTYTSGNQEVKLDKDEYFVLGDNRHLSFDSRKWGPIPKKNLVGIVSFKVFSFKKLIPQF